MSNEVTMVFDAETAKAVNGMLRIENKKRELARRAKRQRDREKALSEKDFHRKMEQATKINERDRQNFQLQMARREKRARLTDQYTEKEKKGITDSIPGLKAVNAMHVAIAASIAVGTKALIKQNAERERSKELAKESARGMGELGQVARSPAELKMLVNEARKSMLEEGMTREEAGRLQFALQSSGKRSQRRTFARLYGMADPTQMLENVNTLQGSMGMREGMRETGRSNQVLDKLLTASGATKTNITDLGAAAASAGKTAGMVGASDEELLAAIAVMARGDASADVVSTQVQALAAAAAKSGEIKTGGGLMDIVSQIEGKKLNEGQLYKLLGRKEAVKGFLGLSQSRGEVQSLTGTLQGVDAAAAAGTGDVTGQRVRAMREVFGTQRLERQMRARKEIAKEDIASRELKRQALLDITEAQGLEAGQNVFTRMGQEWLTSALSYNASDEDLDKMLAIAGAGDQLKQMSAATIANDE